MSAAKVERELSAEEAALLTEVLLRQRLAAGIRENARLLREVAEGRDVEAAKEEDLAAAAATTLGLSATFSWERRNGKVFVTTQ